jgi:hypothetical protein
MHIHYLAHGMPTFVGMTEKKIVFLTTTLKILIKAQRANPSPSQTNALPCPPNFDYLAI